MSKGEQVTEPTEPASVYERGNEIRRQVLGDSYVDAANQDTSNFAKDFQRIVTEYCWGEVWSRPALPRKQRSMLNLAMLCALGRHSELRTHIRGAIRNGCTREEVDEVMLQAAIYCGVPAALDGLRVVRDVLDGEQRDE